MVEKRVRMALIVGASRALAFKRANPHATDDEAIRQVSREASELAEKLDTS